MSDDGEYSISSKVAAKLARLSFITHLRKKNEHCCELEGVIDAKYPVQDVAAEYSIQPSE